MTKKQRKLLKFIRHAPKTLEEIQIKFHLNDAQLYELVFSDNYFSNYFDGISGNADFHKNKIKINNMGTSYLEDWRNDNYRFLIPIAIEAFLSISALAVSILSLYCQFCY